MGSGVTDVVFADFTTGEDNISFETHIQENSLRQSTVGGSLVLSSAVMNMNFQNLPALTDELADTNVDNGSVTNTISELIETTSINPDANMRMYLSHWNYGFDSPEYAASLVNAESKS